MLYFASILLKVYIILLTFIEHFCFNPIKTTLFPEFYKLYYGFISSHGDRFQIIASQNFNAFISVLFFWIVSYLRDKRCCIIFISPFVAPNFPIVCS